jgi:hypothetical protein
MIGLAKLIPGFEVLSKAPLVHMPLDPADQFGTSEQALAGKNAMTSGQVGRNVATYNVPDLFQVAQRTNMVSNELDNFRKLLERFILGSDVTTFEPPNIVPVHTKVAIEQPSVPIQFDFKHPTFKSSNAPMVAMAVGPVCRRLIIDEFL